MVKVEVGKIEDVVKDLLPRMRGIYKDVLESLQSWLWDLVSYGLEETPDNCVVKEGRESCEWILKNEITVYLSDGREVYGDVRVVGDVANDSVVVKEVVVDTTIDGKNVECDVRRGGVCCKSDSGDSEEVCVFL